MHELWVQDPDGTLIEIYARLTDSELAEKPADELPVFLVPGTNPGPQRAHNCMGCLTPHSLEPGPEHTHFVDQIHH